MATKSNKKDAAPERRLILSRGEELVAPVRKMIKIVPPPPPRNFDQAREHLVPQCKKVIAELRQLPKQYKVEGDLVMCMRMHPDMLAKTYDPSTIFRQASGLRNAGSRRWNAPLSEVKETERIASKKLEQKTIESRMIFAQGAMESFEEFVDILNTEEERLPKGFVNDICKFERLDVLRPDESMHFSQTWSEGRSELIFHPFSDASSEQAEFLENLFDYCKIDRQKASIRAYNAGPTFVSVPLTADSVTKLSRCNILRSARELRSIQIPSLRSLASFPAPRPPTSAHKSSVVVGMFDGGVDTNVPHLRDHVVQDATLSTPTPEDPDAVAHGTAVAGAILYGPLNRHTLKSPLPAPPVSVVSFRVFPLRDPNDNDLYEVIDLIENVVPQRPDIQTFNISLGPPGSIEDDPVSRFTWVLDSLAQKHRVTFVNAVGNDGALPPDEGRIQSPSDAVHGLGIGAFTEGVGERIRADYSCYGPGREGGKVKPDVLCFGGCRNRPFHVLTGTGDAKPASGTSYAAPLGSRLHAGIKGLFPQAQSLLARVLMIHNAAHPKRRHCPELGFGFLDGEARDLLYCSDTEVTIVYQKSLPTSKYHRLLIPLPEDVNLPGRSTIRFTLGVMTNVSIRNPGDYTGGCVVEQLCPNWLIYEFRPPDGVKGSPKKLHLHHDEKLIRELTDQGWTPSQLPAVKQLRLTEQEHRTKELKWDTVVRKEWTVQTEGALFQPSVILHSMHRRDETDDIEYAAAVSIMCPKYRGNLYAEIRTRFPQLLPVELRAEADLRIPIRR